MGISRCSPKFLFDFIFSLLSDFCLLNLAQTKNDVAMSYTMDSDSDSGAEEERQLSELHGEAGEGGNERKSKKARMTDPEGVADEELKKEEADKKEKEEKAKKKKPKFEIRDLIGPKVRERIAEGWKMWQGGEVIQTRKNILEHCGVANAEVG